MKPSIWREKFLAKRDLQSADGRYLFQYRIEHSELESLQDVLKGNAMESWYWDACFVLYASEWWRRYYQGGAWSWVGIVEKINQEITVQDRNKIITNGLLKWKRKVLASNNGNDYLGTIILEGGLPIEIISKENGWLKKTVVYTFQKLSDVTVFNNDISGLVKSQAERISYFPQSLMTEGTHRLIGQIVEHLSYLKKRHQLGAIENPVQYLESNEPSWRSKLPLPIESESGLKFINELLTEIVSIKPSNSYPFILERKLVFIEDGVTIKPSLEITQDRVFVKDLQLPQEFTSNLPGNISLFLCVNGLRKRRLCSVLKSSKNGMDTFIFDTSSKHTLAFDITDEFSIEIGNSEQSYALPLTAGEAFEKNVPWVFKQSDGQWLFDGQASYKSTAEALRIIVPSSTVVKEGETRLLCSSERLGNVFEIIGKVKLVIKDESFVIESRSNQNQDENLLLTGIKYLGKVENFSSVFLGMPRLCSVDKETQSRTAVAKRIQMKRKGTTNWEPLLDNFVGVFKVRLLGADNETLFLKKIAVLPPQFAISYKSGGNTPKKGTLTLRDSKKFNVSVKTDDINGKVQSTEDGHSIEVESANELPPEDISVSLENHSGEIVIKTPFPSNGFRTFDGSGKATLPGDRISISSLHGARLYLFNPKQQNCTIALKFLLKAASKEGNLNGIFFKENLSFGNALKEVSLLNYLNGIRTLLSVADLDSCVEVSVNDKLAFSITRYSQKLEKLEEEGMVSLFLNEEECKLLDGEVYVLPLLNLELGRQRLEIIKDQDSNVRKWKFDPPIRNPGPWLIFPGKDSKYSFRPLRWTVGSTHLFLEGEDHELSLRDTPKILDGNRRKLIISQIITEMSKDFSSDNWGIVDLFKKELGHLPLSSIDLWSCFSKNKRALVALLCQQSSDFIERFTSEFTVIWQLIPINDWVDVFKECCQHWEQKLPEFAKEIIDKKVAFIAERLKLTAIPTILNEKLYGVVSEEKERFSNYEMVKLLVTRNFNGGKGDTGLGNRKMEDEWPEYLQCEIIGAFKTLPKKIQDLVPTNINGFQKPVGYLPIILAYKSCHVTSYFNDLIPIDLFRVHMLQQFDEEWFTFIFDLIQYYSFISSQDGTSVL